jgi:sugar phosphate isomerase/epimerase
MQDSTFPSTTLSLSPLTIIDAAPPEQVSAAAAAGFDALGVRVLPAAAERVWPMLGDTQHVRETLARLGDTGLRVLDVELIMLHPDYRERDVLEVLDAGHRLGARFALVLGYDTDRNRLVDSFTRVCVAAADRGIRPGLEFMKYSAVQTIEDAVDVVHRSAHPAGSVLVDALHLQRSGGSPASLRAIPPDLLPYGQLCDGPLLPVWPDDDQARVESRTDRLLPGDGELPLRDLLRALPPGGALSVETPVAALAALPVADRARLAFSAAARLLDAGHDSDAARPR